MDDLKKLADEASWWIEFAQVLGEKRKLVENRNGFDPDDHNYMKKLWAERREPGFFKACEAVADNMRKEIEAGALDHDPEKAARVAKMLDEFAADLIELRKDLAKIPCEHNIAFH